MLVLAYLIKKKYSKKMGEENKVDVSSGNVFADLGLSNPVLADIPLLTKERDRFCVA